MRGKTDQQTSLLVLHPQDMIPTHHPIHRIKPIVDAVLRELSPLPGGWAGRLHARTSRIRARCGRRPSRPSTSPLQRARGKACTLPD